MRFHTLRFLFLLHGRLAILLHGSISLSFGIAPSSALITGSLTPSVIGDRPSHPISSRWTLRGSLRFCASHWLVERANELVGSGYPTEIVPDDEKGCFVIAARQTVALRLCGAVGQ